MGFALSLDTAAAALLSGVAIFAWLVRSHPLAEVPADAAVARLR
jgi:hypothetical protein